MTVAVEDRQITAAEAAAAFGVPRRTLYRWIDQAGLVPTAELLSSGINGTTRYYRLGDLARLVMAWRGRDTPNR